MTLFAAICANLDSLFVTLVVELNSLRHGRAVPFVVKSYFFSASLTYA
jgi:hypothetical protein